MNPDDARALSDEAFARARIYRAIGANGMADACAAQSDHWADLACELTRHTEGRRRTRTPDAAGREIDRCA